MYVVFVVNVVIPRIRFSLRLQFATLLLEVAILILYYICVVLYYSQVLLWMCCVYFAVTGFGAPGFDRFTLVVRSLARVYGKMLGLW